MFFRRLWFLDFAEFFHKFQFPGLITFSDILRFFCFAYIFFDISRFYCFTDLYILRFHWFFEISFFCFNNSRSLEFFYFIIFYIYIIKIWLFLSHCLLCIFWYSLIFLYHLTFFWLVGMFRFHRLSKSSHILSF